MPPSTAMRAATWRTLRPMRSQWGLTAMARSSGQAGAMLRQACAQAASTRWLNAASDRGAGPPSALAPGAIVRDRGREDVRVFMGNRSIELIQRPGRSSGRATAAARRG